MTAGQEKADSEGADTPSGARYLSSMISALVRVCEGQPVAKLGLTLSSLVPGVVHGLVGGAAVLGPPDDMPMRHVADAAGADYLSDGGGGAGWRQAAGHLRGRWVLLLAAGDRLDGDWAGWIERLLLIDPPLALRLRRRPLTPSEWAATLVERATIRPAALTPGLLIRRDLLLGEGTPRATVRRSPVLIATRP